MSDKYRGNVRFPIWALPYLGFAQLDDVPGDETAIEADGLLVYTGENEARYGEHSLVADLIACNIPFDADWPDCCEHEAGQKFARIVQNGEYVVTETYDVAHMLDATWLAQFLDQPSQLAETIRSAARATQSTLTLTEISEAASLADYERSAGIRPKPIPVKFWTVDVTRVARERVSVKVMARSVTEAKRLAAQQVNAMPFSVPPQVVVERAMPFIDEVKTGDHNAH